MNASTEISNYLATIGRKGGQKSRRALSSAQARDMVRIREARKAFRAFYGQCFWHFAPDHVVTLEDLPEIVRGLRTYGGHAGFHLAAKLCRGLNLRSGSR